MLKLYMKLALLTSLALAIEVSSPKFDHTLAKLGESEV